MITWQELLGNYKESEIDPEHLANMKELLVRINKVRDAYGKAMSPTNCYRSLQHHLRIYKDLGITDKAKIPMASRHLTGQAIDISDPKGELMAWCKANVDKLEEFGLWCEEPDKYKRVHFQIVPPKSGRRFFNP